MDNGSAFFFSSQNPLKGDGVMLGSIAAHNQNNICIL